MPAFATPGPILASVHLPSGELRIEADDRDDTVVEVLPVDEGSDADFAAAAQARVDYTGTTLSVGSPRSRAQRLFGRGGSISVTVRLPAGSRVEVRAGMADLRCHGRLGAVRAEVSSGDITTDAVGGPTELTTGNGDIRIGAATGSAVAKSSSGGIAVGAADADLRLRTSYGDISVDRVLGGVDARTAYGRITVGEVVRGWVDLETKGGKVEIGVRAGTAAWLDAVSRYGKVTSGLQGADGPGEAEETAEIHARTSYGDIHVHRA